MGQSRSQDGERSGNYINQQYSGHGDQQSFQPGQNPNYGDQRNRKGGDTSSEIKYPPRLNPSMSYGSQDYYNPHGDDLWHPSSQFNSLPPNQYGGAGGVTLLLAMITIRNHTNNNIISSNKTINNNNSQAEVIKDTEDLVILM